MMPTRLSLTRILSARELKATPQTAITLIPAPGGGKLIVVRLVVFLFTAGSDAGSDPLVYSAPLNLQIGTGVPAIDPDTHCFVDQAATAFSTWVNLQYDGPAFDGAISTLSESGQNQEGNDLLIGINQPVVLTTHTDDPAKPAGNAANDCALQMDIEYSIHLLQNPVPPVIISQQPSR